MINIGYSQSNIINSPFLVSSSGGQWIQGDYNLCFSLGEIAIETHISNSVILTQGFHQESFYEIVELDKGVSKHNIKIYPNPTENSININCNVNEKIALTIQDVKGNIVFFAFLFPFFLVLTEGQLNVVCRHSHLNLECLRRKRRVADSLLARINQLHSGHAVKLKV